MVDSSVCVCGCVCACVFYSCLKRGFGFIGGWGLIFIPSLLPIACTTPPFK